MRQHAHSAELRRAIAVAATLPPVDAPADIGLWVWLDEDGGVSSIATTAQAARDRALHNALNGALDDEVTPMVALGWVLDGVPVRLDHDRQHVGRLLRLLTEVSDRREVGVHMVMVEDELTRRGEISGAPMRAAPDRAGPTDAGGVR